MYQEGKNIHTLTNLIAYPAEKQLYLSVTIITQIITSILTAKTTPAIIDLIFYHSHFQITVLPELFCSEKPEEVCRLSITVFMEIPKQRE